MKLLVSMGIPASDFHKKDEGFRYNGAVIQQIDWDKKSLINEISYQSPAENLGQDLSMMFKGAYVSADELWVVSNTELLKYELSSGKLQQVYTDNSFNDLHGVYVDKGQIYVCNTGLEIVQQLSETGDIINEWNIAECPTWGRFDRQKDYRLIATTKPHEVHINHLFTIDDELWVNLGSQRKARAVNNKNRVIDMNKVFGNDEKVLCHDGLVKQDFIYFTSVNGSIVVVNKDTLKVEERIVLN